MGQNDCNTKMDKRNKFHNATLNSRHCDFAGKTKQCTQGAFANSRHFRSGSCGCNDPLQVYMSLFGDSLQAAKKNKVWIPRTIDETERMNTMTRAIKQSQEAGCHLEWNTDEEKPAEKCKNCVPKGGIRAGKRPLAPATVRRHHLHLQPGQG